MSPFTPHFVRPSGPFDLFNVYWAKKPDLIEVCVLFEGRGDSEAIYSAVCIGSE